MIPHQLVETMDTFSETADGLRELDRLARDSGYADYHSLRAAVMVSEDTAAVGYFLAATALVLIGRSRAFAIIVMTTKRAPYAIAAYCGYKALAAAYTAYRSRK